MYKIITDYLTPNKYSRPQIELKEIKKLVIHWVGNTNTTAKQNRHFFENRKNGKTGYGSSQEIIDLSGNVWVIIPDNEISYGCANNDYYYNESGLAEELGKYPNDSIYSIECTHTTDEGFMSLDTYLTLIDRVSDLCIKYNLNPMEDVIRHFDITGKICPKYFVDNPDKFIEFKQQVKGFIDIKLNDDNNWKNKLAIESINNLTKKGFLNNPEEHIENLKNETIEPYVFWAMIDRLSE